MTLKTIPTQAGPIKIHFEDTHLIVLEKPAGLLSQGDISEDENLVDVLRLYFGRNYVGLVHRLDRNVSGLMVVAKRSKSADRLSEALRAGELERKYTAWVLGIPKESFTLRHFLLKDEKKNEVRVVASANIAGAKEAVLHARRLRVIESAGPIFGDRNIPQVSEVELTLETGRSHQIRVQLSYAGHPILYDPKYGNQGSGPKLPSLHLCSSYLRFPHPMTKEIQEYECQANWRLSVTPE